MCVLQFPSMKLKELLDSKAFTVNVKQLDFFITLELRT